MVCTLIACEMQRECGKNTICLKDGAGYKCECKKGYILDDDGECVGMGKSNVYVSVCIMALLVDLNECLHGHRPVVGHYCPTEPEDVECINTDGGFKCKCPDNHEFIDRGGHDSECKGTEKFVLFCLKYIATM